MAQRKWQAEQLGYIPDIGFDASDKEFVFAMGVFSNPIGLGGVAFGGA
jgi:hypothetical protein